MNLPLCVLSNVFLVISKSASNGEFCTSLRNVAVKEVGRKGIGHNGCLKNRRRSIGSVKRKSLLSLLSSSDDVVSQFSERISLIKNDFDVVVDVIGNNS
jgi:hypothetical protein